MKEKTLKLINNKLVYLIIIKNNIERKNLKIN
jgi:hypothetical protein